MSKYSRLDVLIFFSYIIDNEEEDELSPSLNKYCKFLQLLISNLFRVGGSWLLAKDIKESHPSMHKFSRLLQLQVKTAGKGARALQFLIRITLKHGRQSILWKENESRAGFISSSLRKTKLCKHCGRISRLSQCLTSRYLNSEPHPGFSCSASSSSTKETSLGQPSMTKL
ncbi:conserved hypothetical protein [Ricinus communis]|uniref:Uncharacterized protein n=1 Tax=Ricinus communis TaxID=3988 RepID=B9S0Y1_RICCO|nr:conserved hypothetical protein [Ricinus communis]